MHLEGTQTSAVEKEEAETTCSAVEMEDEHVSRTGMTVTMATATIGITIMATATIGIITTMRSGTATTIITASGRTITARRIKQGTKKTYQTFSRSSWTQIHTL